MWRAAGPAAMARHQPAVLHHAHRTRGQHTGRKEQQQVKYATSPPEIDASIDDIARRRERLHDWLCTTATGASQRTEQASGPGPAESVPPRATREIGDKSRGFQRAPALRRGSAGARPSACTLLSLLVPRNFDLVLALRSASLHPAARSGRHPRPPAGGSGQSRVPLRRLRHDQRCRGRRACCRWCR